MPSSVRLFATALVLALAGLPPAARAQDALARAVDLERLGRYEEAATQYRQLLEREPTSPQGLLGLERASAALGRRDSVLAAVRRALAVDSANAIARTIEVRTARAQGGDAAAAEAIARWMAVAPRSEAPYRELVRTLIAAGKFDDARAAVDTARARLHDPDLLGPELAQVEAAAGNWGRAAEIWRAVLLRRRDLANAAAFNLRGAPVPQRERVVRALLGTDSADVAVRVSADLLLAWNESQRAWTMLRGALPTGEDERRALLQIFAERARQQGTPEGKRVAAAAQYEELAATATPAVAVQMRVEAARVWAEAGDPQAARRVLRSMAEDPNAPADVGASTAAALIELYARENNAAEAAQLLAQHRPRLPGTEADRLAIVVARAWIRTDAFDRAEQEVQNDPSLAADDVRGWVAVYRGRLGDARPLLRGAGMVLGDDPFAVERAAISALLSHLRTDSLPALGEALFTAERGDTAAAVRALVALARAGVPGDDAELLALAARWSQGRDRAQAEALWTEVLEQHPDAPSAPVAALALARDAIARSDMALAQRRLEDMILRYPDSALVPEARRELDRVRGLVPRS